MLISDAGIPSRPLRSGCGQAVLSAPLLPENLAAGAKYVARALLWQINGRVFQYSRASSSDP